MALHAHHVLTETSISGLLFMMSRGSIQLYSTIGRIWMELTQLGTSQMMFINQVSYFSKHHINIHIWYDCSLFLYTDLSHVTAWTTVNMNHRVFPKVTL